MAIQPAPTYQLPFIGDRETMDKLKVTFSPVWLKWFLDLAAEVDASGTGTVTNTSGALTANAVILGNGGDDIVAGAVLSSDANTYFNGNGAFTNIIKVLANAGSAGSPSITFSGDPDTGMYNAAANALGFVVGGTTGFLLDSAGKFYPGTNGVQELGASSNQWGNIWGTVATASQPNITTLAGCTSLRGQATTNIVYSQYAATPVTPGVIAAYVRLTTIGGTSAIFAVYV